MQVKRKCEYNRFLCIQMLRRLPLLPLRYNIKWSSHRTHKYLYSSFKYENKTQNSFMELLNRFEFDTARVKMN